MGTLWLSYFRPKGNSLLVLADLVQDENKESRGEYLGLPTLSDEGCNTLLELFAPSERELVEQWSRRNMWSVKFTQKANFMALLFLKE